jgi:hypothetical protein
MSNIKGHLNRVKKCNRTNLSLFEYSDEELDRMSLIKVCDDNKKFICEKCNIRFSTNGNLIMPNGELFHFGVLTSQMHMAWVKNICGRLKSDFRYSKDIVYNNFPWPENPSEKQVKAIENAAQKILDTRLQFQNSSLADLYDPLSMPKDLTKAHNELDKVVDLAYRSQAFSSEANRMEFLFGLYEKYTADLFTKEKVKKGKAKKELKTEN